MHKTSARSLRPDNRWTRTRCSHTSKAGRGLNRSPKRYAWLFPLKGPTGLTVPSRPDPRIENNTLKCGTLVTKARVTKKMIIIGREDMRISHIISEKNTLKSAYDHRHDVCALIQLAPPTTRLSLVPTLSSSKDARLSDSFGWAWERDAPALNEENWFVRVWNGFMIYWMVTVALNVHIKLNLLRAP